MTLGSLQPDYQYIQNTIPSGAKESDWWLDTSTSPPVSKVYDGSSFIETRAVANLDQTLSTAGKTATDKASQQEIQDAILSDGTTFDGADIDDYISNIATPSDAGGGIDWTVLTLQHDNETSTNYSGTKTLVSLSGSGYLFRTMANTDTPTYNNGFVVTIDGSSSFDQAFDSNENYPYFQGYNDSGSEKIDVPYTRRFDASLKVELEHGTTADTVTEVIYALD